MAQQRLSIQEQANYIISLALEERQKKVAVSPPSVPQQQQEAPIMPRGFEALATPRSLSADPEARWCVFAHDIRHDLDGILIYEDMEPGRSYAISFYPAQEFVLLVMGTMEHLIDVLVSTHSDFFHQHYYNIYHLGQTWHELTCPVKEAPRDEEHARLCSWCWFEVHPDQPFPAAASSSCCDTHKQQLRGGGKEGKHHGH